MDPEIRNFKELERFIKERPKEADALAFRWQEFAKQNPDTLPTDTEILLGKDIEEVYFYLRDQHEDEQMRTQGGVNPSIVPAELVALSILALAFRDRPKIIEDDRDYQKLVEQHKKSWLEKNPGKDFTSKEGLDYLHGSLEDENAPSLKKDAEKAFRDNPKYRKRLERYDKESKKVYKNIDDDPRMIKTKEEIEEHTKTRQEYLRTHEEDKGPENISQIIHKHSWDRFVRENPEKAGVYATKDDDRKNDNVRRLIKDAIEREGRGRIKQYVEETISEPAAPTTTYQPSIQAPTRGFFNRGIVRGPSRLGGRLAGRTGSMAGKLAGRLAIQGGMAVGRGAVAFFATPPGWITAAVIAVIILIIVIVFIIIMLAGGGGGGSTPGRLYECSSGFDFATSTANCSSGPDVDCIDPAGNTILVPNGNTCAANAATFYSAKEGIPITASCADKCTDSPLTKICSPDVNNNCPDPNFTCQGFEGTPVSGAGSKTFCIQYITPTPTPTPALADILFPANAGVIDVKDPLYGAMGDGVTDDTAAIQKAVSDGLFLSKGKEQTAIIYFPSGTYLVSNTILPKVDPTAAGGWSPYLTLQGQHQDKTIIKLKDNAPGYSDKSSPKAILYTASASFVCKDISQGGIVEWIAKGECNEAYNNYIVDITVDAGKGNTGAIGIDYLASNNGAVQNVKIVSGDGQGYIGLALTRRWQGPGLVKNVVVEGFDYGIKAGDAYSMTLEHVTLKDQKIVGIHTRRNVLSLRDLQSINSVPVIINDLSTAGLIVLVDGNLQGTGLASSLPAIDNRQGEMFVRNVAAPGYSSVIKNKGTVIPGAFITEFYSFQDEPLYTYSLFNTPEKSLGLPVAETPDVPWDPLDKWISAKDFGANGDGDPSFDNTPKVQAAIDAAESLGKTTLYFPKGRYAFGDTIHIRGNIRRVHLMMSGFGVVNSPANKFGDGRPFIQIDEGSHPILVIQGAGVPFSTGATVGPRFTFKHISPKALVLKNSGGSYENVAGSGSVFFEDMQSCAVFHSTKVWARQLDPEACAPPAIAFDPKILNDGSDVWILGLKTEVPATIIDTKNGGKTEVLGGFFSPGGSVPLTMPVFRNTESGHSLSFVVNADSMGASHQIIIEETRSGVTKQLNKSQVPPKGFGSMMPFFVGYK